ncbi:MAG: hypothetical protein PVG20_00630, partial [Thioalkalispiraceae bacterium]
MRATTTDGQAFSAGGIRIIVLLLVFVSLAGLGYFFYTNAQQASADQTYIQRLGDQRVLSQEIAKLASSAARGRLDAFPALQTAYSKFKDILQYQMRATQDLAAVQMLNKDWKAYGQNIDTILQRREVVTSMRSYINNINEQIPTLLALSDEVVATMTRQGAAADQVYIATRQLMLTQRISSNVSLVLEGGEGAVTAADRFGRDAALFGSVIQSMLRGNPAKRIQKITNPNER